MVMVEELCKYTKSHLIAHFKRVNFAVPWWHKLRIWLKLLPWWGLVSGPGTSHAMSTTTTKKGEFYGMWIRHILHLYCLEPVRMASGLILPQFEPQLFRLLGITSGKLLILLMPQCSYKWGHIIPTSKGY